ncbi:unnamed protein product [Clonostachys rosea f. rosea IK726]|uniref:Uncharacterized protein n=1 Tax=Clonostachys rosea f. rosea IK726 TaxID=1349383 RepID=A0ACA9TM44_BIOOC|nr:unnamed protein product [Clonostachys rosea f. rosea IK726]
MDQEDAPLLSSQPSTATPVQDRRKPNAILDIWLGFSPYFKYCIGLELLSELAMMIITVPMVSILEHSLCMRHYHGEIPDADACKIPPIQQSLAEVRGWTASFETIAAILVALPMGRLADNRGQRGVFMIIMLGILMSLTWSLFIIASAKLPIRLVWASSIFLLVGGGRYAAEMILAAMVAKACNEETRTRGLYHFYSCFILAELIGPPIASVAADVSPWLPFIISYILLFLTFPVLVIMSKYDTAPQSPHTSHEQSMHPGVPPVSRNCLRIALSATIDQFQILKFLFSTGKMRLASTNALISEVALVNLLFFLFIVPALLRVVGIYLKPEAQILSLGILKSSLTFLFVGSLLIAFAASSPLLIASTMIYGLGFGARSALLSLVTSWIDPECTGTLYSAVFLLEQIGMLGGEPLIQNLLGIAVGLPDPWKSLPFICASHYQPATSILTLNH